MSRIPDFAKVDLPMAPLAARGSVGQRHGSRPKASR